MDKKNEISYSTYRIMDLFIFTILFVLFEFILSGAVEWFEGKFYITLYFAFALIIMMRWSFYSIIPIIIMSVTYCIANDGVLNDYITFIIGNLFILFNLLWFKLSKQKIREFWYSFIYVITGFIVVEIGRALLSMILGGSFIDSFIQLTSSDFISLFITCFIVLISRKQNGLFEDQKIYLKRIYLERLQEEEVNK